MNLNPNPIPYLDLNLNLKYFSREFCLKELRWAIDAGKAIQPVIRAEDKANIGMLMADAPEDLRFIGGIDFIDLERKG